jgi:protein-disulfide isomerase-like protein with CxxC motif
MNIWSNLPADHVVQAKTGNSFKNKLDKFWSDQKLLYDNFKAKFKITVSDKTKYKSLKSDPSLM